MIGIINYGSGNIAALMNIFKQKKIPHYLASSAKELAEADRYLLPGVGAFDPTMKQLTESGLFDALEEQVHGPRQKPILGICVGMQLLAEGSEEGERPGLGWIKGHVRRIDAQKLNTLPHLPHMGWNSVRSQGAAHLLRGIDAEKGFYFLHSYHFDATNQEDIAATVSYGGDLVCAVERGHVFGVQFHPEKSHRNGVAVLTNFAEVA